MIAVVLVGVMIDRATLTMRTIAVAALAVMLLVPEAVVHPSFQMSFAATLALIGTYQGGLAWATAGADTSLGARLALWGVREIVLLAMASLVAGLATTPYAAYHFHRQAPYGVLANVLAMPVISAVSMPAGLHAMPFGFDGPRLTEHPERIRLTLRKGTAPPVGAHVAFKARLNPPASPFRPGGYDLARDLYFRGIGATGLALGAIRMEAPPVEPDWRLQFAIGIEQIRDASMPASAPRSRATPGRSHPRSSPARKTRSAATCSRLASCPDVIPSCPDRASEVAIP